MASQGDMDLYYLHIRQIHLPLAADKRGQPHNILLICSQKTYVVGTHQKSPAEALLMCMHNMKARLKNALIYYIQHCLHALRCLVVFKSV